MIKDFLSGVAFGVTQVIPGVSGGTIAIIMGFYDKLIETANHFTKKPRRYLRFLLPFCSGVALGIILLSSAVSFLITYHSFPSMMFFIGLIIGIVPLIFKKSYTNGQKPFSFYNMLTIVSMLILVFISHLGRESTPTPEVLVVQASPALIILIFFAGILSAAALVVPGLSGSFVLLIMGVYPLITYSVASIRLLITDITNIQLMLNILKILLPLGIGIVIGGLSMARIIERLLENHTKFIYSIILGLMLGSVYALFNEPILYQSGVTATDFIIGFVMLMAGVFASYTLGKKRI